MKNLHFGAKVFGLKFVCVFFEMKIFVKVLVANAVSLVLVMLMNFLEPWFKLITKVWKKKMQQYCSRWPHFVRLERLSTSCYLNQLGFVSSNFNQSVQTESVVDRTTPKKNLNEKKFIYFFTEYFVEMNHLIRLFDWTFVVIRISSRESRFVFLSDHFSLSVDLYVQTMCVSCERAFNSHPE